MADVVHVLRVTMGYSRSLYRKEVRINPDRLLTIDIEGENRRRGVRIDHMMHTRATVSSIHPEDIIGTIASPFSSLAVWSHIVDAGQKVPNILSAFTVIIYVCVGELTEVSFTPAT